ncbi:MAG: hypothetical protein KKA73_19070 [Chloroflexi bacterium]|nr:hypothetical protein [Chloroflexota bacterium]MBU1749792.1 hypothetical protein [Chloroflexota bacterium]
MTEVANLVKEALSVILALTGFFLFVGFAYNFVAQQVHIMTGSSRGLERAWSRIGGMLVGLGLVLAAAPISQVIVDALAGL